MKIKTLDDFKNHPAYKYAVGASDGSIVVNKSVQKVCQSFIDELEKADIGESKYYFDFDFFNKICMMCNFINIPSGLKVGQPIGESLAGFQWFFIANSLAWKMSDNHEKRRYEKSVLLIARKSGKTFLISVLFIILLLLEPRFSNFYSVAPDLELSSLILQEIQNQIAVSPLINKHFKITKGQVQSKINDNKFQPLATSNNRMDGRLAAVYVADEVGALRNRYPIDAMESSQMNVVNRTGILISTAYASLNNPMTQEVEVAEKVINGELKDDRLFALLYKPDKPNEWMTLDDELIKANPLALEVPETMEFLLKQRERAINSPDRRKNFLTKHMNIFVNGEESEAFLHKEDLDKVEVDPGTINWYGRDVYLGIDLSMTNDNTAVSMSNYDYDERKIFAKSWVFYPRGKEAEKTKFEKIDYPLMTERGFAFATGNQIIDYEFIENFIMSIEENYGVNVKGIGYDKWNAVSTVSKLSNANFDMYEISQNAAGLYPGTKFLKESILSENFAYEKNELFRANFLNAKMITNTNMSYFLNKKQSDGKIDMIAALVNSLALWRDEVDEEDYSDEGIIIL